MNHIEKMFQDAIGSLNAGRLSDAEQILNTIVKNEPTHIGALNVLAIMLMQMQRNEEAEKFAKAAIDINQSSDVTFYNYGLILKALNRPRDALLQFNKALALNSAVAETWNNRGTIFNDLAEYKNAIL